MIKDISAQFQADSAKWEDPVDQRDSSSLEDNGTNGCEKWLGDFRAGAGGVCKVWKQKGHKEGEREERGFQKSTFVGTVMTTQPRSCSSGLENIWASTSKGNTVASFECFLNEPDTGPLHRFGDNIWNGKGNVFSLENHFCRWLFAV